MDVIETAVKSAIILIIIRAFFLSFVLTCSDSEILKPPFNFLLNNTKYDLYTYNSDVIFL